MKSCCRRMSSGSSCLNVNVSTIVGCGGNAPIIVSRCTRAAALAPLPALDAGAGLAADGAALGAGESLVDPLLAGASAGESDGVSIVVIGAGAGAVTGATGVTGAAMGLTGLIGDSGLVGLVTDFVHESLTRFQLPQTAEPYGSGQTLWRA